MGLYRSGKLDEHSIARPVEVVPQTLFADVQI